MSSVITLAGRPSAPYLFNTVMDLVAPKFRKPCERWKDRDLGFRDDDFHIPMLDFADNV